MKQTKVLITGGAGFIGSHLAEKLVSLGAQVTILDNLSSGTLENIHSIKNNIEFIFGDIRDIECAQNSTKNQEIIFHLAAETSVPASIENVSACYDINIIGTLNLLQAAIKNRCKRFIFSSSAAVYGPSDEPCIEKTPCKPTSPYGHSKLIGEQLCTYFYKHYGLNTVCLRYFNVYGNRQNNQRPHAGVVTQFRRCLQNNIPITVYGDGTQVRDFVPVEKVVHANIATALAQPTLVEGETFNIASGASITVLALIEQLRQEFPSYNADILFLPARAGDIYHSRANCLKFNTLMESVKLSY